MPRVLLSDSIMWLNVRLSVLKQILLIDRLIRNGWLAKTMIDRERARDVHVEA